MDAQTVLTTQDRSSWERYCRIHRLPQLKDLVLRKHRLFQYDFRDTSFLNLDSIASYYEVSTFECCNFTDAVFHGGLFDNCRFYHCNFSSTNWHDLLIRDCVFSSCDFTKSNLKYMHLGEETAYENCTFVDANLRGVGLQGATFTNVQWPRTDLVNDWSHETYMIHIQRRCITVGCASFSPDQWIDMDRCEFQARVSNDPYDWEVFEQCKRLLYTQALNLPDYPNWEVPHETK